MAQNTTPTYDLFIKSYVSASFQKKSKEMQFRDGQKLWNAIKSDKKNLITTFQELKAKSVDSQLTLLYFWKNCPNTTTATNTSTTIANMFTTTASAKPRPTQEQTINRLTEVNNDILDTNGLLSSD